MQYVSEPVLYIPLPCACEYNTLMTPAMPTRPSFLSFSLSCFLVQTVVIYRPNPIFQHKHRQSPPHPHNDPSSQVNSAFVVFNELRNLCSPFSFLFSSFPPYKPSSWLASYTRVKHKQHSETSARLPLWPGYTEACVRAC